MSKPVAEVFQCASVPAAVLIGRQNYLPPVENFNMLKANVLQYGIRVPLLVSRSMRIISGTELFLAAFAVGIRSVPVLISPDLSPFLKKELKRLHYDLLTCSEWDTIGASLGGVVVF